MKGLLDVGALLILTATFHILEGKIDFQCVVLRLAEFIINFSCKDKLCDVWERIEAT